MIKSFEDADKLADDEEAANVLERINAFLDGGDVGGGLLALINRAKAHDSEIENSLGADVRRFKSILPEYRDNPQLAIDRRWLEAYQTVLARPDTEMMYIPEGLGELMVKLKTLEEASQRRLKMSLDEKTRRTNQAAYDSNRTYNPRADQFELNKANPTLIIKDGKVVPRADGK